MNRRTSIQYITIEKSLNVVSMSLKNVCILKAFRGQKKIALSKK